MKIKTILWSIVLSIILTILVSKIFFPAYLSYTGVCKPQEFEARYSDNYYVAGQVTITPTETGNDTVEVFILDEKDIPTIMHEKTHLWQYSKDRLYSCDRPLLKYMNEVTAYTVQLFWEVRLLF